MTINSRRRWFRFSLRTLLVAMTALCCWLGWESSVVRGRKALLREIKDNPAYSITTASAYAGRFRYSQPIGKVATIPFIRRWLGDEAVQEIFVVPHFQGFSREQLAQLTRAFPEAELREVHPEPCHPGCFPAGTLVATSRGPQLIETIQPGDKLVAFRSGNEQIVGSVNSVFTTTNRLWKIETAGGMLLTTETQPLCLGSGEVRPAGQLSAGDIILRWQDSGLAPETVISVTSTNRVEKVFNLVLGDSELFLAGGFLARSKPPREAVAVDNE